MNVQRASEDVLARHKAPVTAVLAVVAAVAHDEIAIRRNGNRIFNGELHTMEIIEIIAFPVTFSIINLVSRSSRGRFGPDFLEG